MWGDITFRLADQGDLAALAHMRWENRVEARTLTPEQADQERPAFLAACLRFLEDAHASGRWGMWVAAAPDGSLIASAFVQVVDKVPRPFQHEACWGYLTNVYTQPEWRGHGIGAQLIERAKEWSRRQGLELLHLWPSEKSLDFYRRLGFSAPTGTLTIELNPYEDNLL